MHPKFTLAVAALAATAGAAHAADWSDTALSVRYGTTFAEPFDLNADGSKKDIKKAIIALTHVSGYKYGTNFFNVDFLISDHNDPGWSNSGATTTGAQEVYGVYRTMLDLGKVTGTDFKSGYMRGLGVTAGFDLNSKNDFYSSKKQMFVIGPTLMLEAPGFVNLSALLLSESNAPANIGARYHYKAHGALEADWGVGIPGLPLTFNGYALFIGSKGKNEFGGGTSPETHVDMNIMFDAGAAAGGPKKTFLVGFEYEYWHNKFGNPTDSPVFKNPGATASTPMIRAEYHF